MGKLVFSRSTSVASCFVLLLLVKVAARVHKDNNDQLLLSDGSDHDSFRDDHLKGMGILETKSSDELGNSSCSQMFGVLPCSTNLVGHILIIVLYDYLLYWGESLATHDARGLLFSRGYFGAVVFQLLDSLPEPLVIAVSVALSKNEAVEEHLEIAIGLLVGSPMLLLTYIWGHCVLFGSRKFDFEEISTENTHWLQQRLTGTGVVIDSETNFRARFLLISLIPIITISIPMAVGVSSAYENIVLILALLIAVLCLLAYFLCQHLDDMILERTREYIKFDRTMETHVPFYEVQELMSHRNKHLMSMAIEMEKNMRDHNNMNIRSKDGVPDTFKEWFFKKMHAMEDPNSHKKFNKVAQLLYEEKISLIKVLIDGMVPHDFPHGDDETQRKLAIARLFEELDTDGDSSISPPELKRFLKSKQRDVTVNEEVFEIILTNLDVDGDGNIDREEFKIGMASWIWEIEQHCESQKNHETDQENRWHVAKAILFLLLGTGVLIFFAEPMTQTVLNASESFKRQPFYVTLIIFPPIRHHRTVRDTLRAAIKKRHRVTSSTFSKIYHKMLMNNLMGFSLLLFVMIYRGLTWHFSAEVLPLVIVCSIVGILASFSSKIRKWTSFIAVMYPLSVTLLSINLTFYRS